MSALMIKPVRNLFVAVAMAATAFVAVSPLQMVHAQTSATRGLPDFTDLVDQVGPSVVNIRTMEKATPRSMQGMPGDEDMQEFFKRFGIPMPNVPRQAPARIGLSRNRKKSIRVVWAPVLSSPAMASS